jgi:hypothetical protein
VMLDVIRMGVITTPGQKDRSSSRCTCKGSPKHRTPISFQCFGAFTPES